MAKLHAKLRPPSAADRWLACPASPTVTVLYPEEDTAHSEKGDMAHDALETCIQFGLTMPKTEDVDVNESVALALEWVAQLRVLHPTGKLYSERRLTIPETGEFGTTDIIMVTDYSITIGDYKNGFVVTEAYGQMMNYLCGAIHEFGPRPNYKLAVIQPNGSHIDGPIREMTVTEQMLRGFRGAVANSIKRNHLFVAGPHCKKTYCPHRGQCATFLAWAEDNAADAWYPSEVNALTDEALAKALDHAEILAGIRTELRKEAMRRILSMDKTIHGYKLVKGRNDRQIADEAGAKELMVKMGAADDDMYEKTFVSAAGVERFIKKYAQRMNLPRGAWKEIYDNTAKAFIRDYAGGLTLERATDARPAHKRGSEFGSLLAPPQTRETV